MMDELGTLQISDPKQLKALDDLAASTGTFVDMADTLGLDRASDFQGSNLRDVDFTNSDLRGFDFSGADLRGSYGVNIGYDDTTSFEGADVEGSPFSHVVLERTVRRENAGFEKEYNLLRKAYWADQLPMVLERIKKVPDPKTARLMAMRLFADTKDSVVRGDMIRVLRFLGLDAGEYLSFLLNVCATRTEPVVLVTAIDALSALYRDRRPVFDTLLTLTSHGSEAVRIAAYEGIVRSRHLKQYRDEVARKLSAGASPRIRRAIASRIAPTVGIHGRAIMGCEPFAKAIGFNHPLNDRTFQMVSMHVGGYDYKVRREVMAQARHLAEELVDLGMPVTIERRAGDFA